MGTWLVVSDPIAKADALVLTYAAAERRDGVDLAARLYTTGVVPCILAASLGGPEVEPLLTPPAGELARSALIQGGVPEEAIALLPPSDGEAALAESVRDAVVGRRWRRMIVVTTDYRSRRTALAMRAALRGTGIDAVVVALPNPHVQLHRWWRSRHAAARVWNEYPRILYYVVRQLLGR